MPSVTPLLQRWYALIQGQYGTNDWGGTRSPDIVGAVRVDQAWGLCPDPAAAHDIHPAYYGATEPTGHPADKWGWAVQGSLSIKNIPTGAGDSINLQAVYTDGATRYNFQNLVPAELLDVQRHGHRRLPERRFRRYC